jgi:site-specific recombinase XerD
MECEMSNPASPTFATLVQEFFTDYMVQQRALSPCTVASYRDTFVLLLRFAQKQLGKAPVSVQLTDINAKFLAAFLDHLESERHNSARSRNIRLAAVRSFLKFAARRDLANLRVIEQALAVPMKRFDRKMVGFLPGEQMLAVIDVPTETWIG